MSEEYSNGYARGYEAGQQSVLKLAEQPAQQEPDLSEQGRTRSAILGNNVEAMMDAGLPFLKALETTLKVYDHDTPKVGCVNHDCDKCKAQQQQEPVAWVDPKHLDWLAQSPDNLTGAGLAARQRSADMVSLYTSPPASKPWVSLTDEEIQKEFHPLHATGLQFARSIEAKLKEKNT